MRTTERRFYSVTFTEPIPPISYESGLPSSSFPVPVPRGSGDVEATTLL